MLSDYIKHLACIAMMLIVLAASQPSPLRAQKIGPAAKGGSLAMGRKEDARTEADDSSPEAYRGAVLKLGLEYDKMLAEYSQLRTAAHPPSFKSVILAHLVAREFAPSGPEKTARDILQSLGGLGSLERAVASTLKSHVWDAKQYTRAAEKQLKRAAAQAAKGGTR
jgi:hypothetical protein